MSVAPFFSQRARDRRAALRAARKLAPGAYVSMVLGYPLEDVADGDFRQPLILEASRTGIAIRSLDRLTGVSDQGWASIPPITVELIDVQTPVMNIGDRKYFGVHGSGSFALSYQQLQRRAKRIERQRPA